MVLRKSPVSSLFVVIAFQIRSLQRIRQRESFPCCAGIRSYQTLAMESGTEDGLSVKNNLNSRQTEPLCTRRTAADQQSGQRINRKHVHHTG